MQEARRVSKPGDWPVSAEPMPAMSLSDFRDLVWQKGLEYYRDLPWRRTTDPYEIWISEVMLQQTQVTRVDGRWQHWLERFPTVESLAKASKADVLEEWQGMGYNRRALALHKAAQMISAMPSGFPKDEKELQELPGIGPATAAGIRAFAFGLPSMYLETNVRAVFLHHLYPNEVGVADKRLVPLVRASCESDDPRGWYYALLDYGAWLKRSVPNPSRRSQGHVRQSGFEGSHRQKRAQVVRLLLGAGPRGLNAARVAQELSIEYAEACDLLEELAQEDFCSRVGDTWRV